LAEAVSGTMKTKYLLLAGISGAIITLDQLTKLYILTGFRLGESLEVIPNFFNITYVRNFGAAFGFLADSHPAFREIFFLSVPLLAMIVILQALKTTEESDRPTILSFSLIFGGAIGNYIDRLRFRYVVDFLDFHLAGYSWPAFNIADSSIVVGVSILLLLTFTRKNKKI
jgi:signal peptidase II